MATILKESPAGDGKAAGGAAPSASTAPAPTPTPAAAATEKARHRRDENDDRTTGSPTSPGCHCGNICNHHHESVALMLQYSGVKFVRYYYVDLANQPRCKAVPLAHFLRNQPTLPSDSQSSCPDPAALARVAFASVVMGGLPNYGDVCLPNSGYDASGTVYVEPDLSTMRILPYSPKSCLLTGRLVSGGGSTISELCTRSLLQSTLDRLGGDFGLGISAGFELEFCLWDRATKQPVDKANFASTIPLNRHEEFLSTVWKQLQQQGVEVELLHAESAHGQFELVLRHRPDVRRAVDDVYRAKETVESVAHQQGVAALFLPKVSPDQAGSGLHVHMSLHGTRRRPDTSSNTPDPSSSAASTASGLQTSSERFVEGVLRHLPALLGLSIPTANSFRRVGPGCWTGSAVAWGIDDKEAPIRVVPRNNDTTTGTLAWEHWEYKLCDATANLYLALSGIVLAGMHGLQSGWDLRAPLSRSAVETTESAESEAAFPASVEQALDRLEADEYLRDQMHPSLLRAYLALRRAEAVRAAAMTLQDEVDEAFRRA